jgi:cytoskeletal protein RodZ
MRSVGEILRTAREKRKIKLSEVAETTKIKREFLEAIESDQFQKISSEVAAKGFIRNYAEFLGLSSQAALSVFRRDFVEKPRQLGGFPKPGFVWTPKTTLLVMAVVFSLLIGVYLIRQYLSLSAAPY